ncbi:hypothetical protein Pth03_31610 [Planotetraspora thailandica]|uniref:Uncharacterized protein n=1 Tax=Planotetraspora thailandica TaxID=487172 RepID=A0A8J3XTV9_9ACTN|nr:DUF6203 family protein [Planotetraspora thailandica]GII54772.1 hypothetical protein Pth03_31610 [Planotetraspora thailandica]
MRHILQFLVTRWLSKTPLGLVLLGIGWWILRKRRAGRTPDMREQERRPHAPRQAAAPGPGPGGAGRTA